MIAKVLGISQPAVNGVIKRKREKLQKKSNKYIMKDSK
ncbi:MAG: hypothetical protein Q9M36_03655 [Sulfurovum sp.]|nr:hypothetical protein [Sulfurovum sp.]